MALYPLSLLLLIEATNAFSAVGHPARSHSVCARMSGVSPDEAAAKAKWLSKTEPGWGKAADVDISSAFDEVVSMLDDFDDVRQKKGGIQGDGWTAPSEAQKAKDKQLTFLRSEAGNVAGAVGTFLGAASLVAAKSVVFAGVEGVRLVGTAVVSTAVGAAQAKADEVKAEIAAAPGRALRGVVEGAQRAAAEQTEAVVEDVKERARDSPRWVLQLAKEEMARKAEEKRQLKVAQAELVARAATAREQQLAQLAELAKAESLLYRAKAKRTEKEMAIERAIADGTMKPPTLQQKLAEELRQKLARK